MKSKNLIGKIEESLVLNSSDGKYCPHSPAEIIFPDNKTERFPPCNLCDLSPLRVVLYYCDNRLTPRKIANARRALAASAVNFPNEPAERRIAAVCVAFGCCAEDLLVITVKPPEN